MRGTAAVPGPLARPARLELLLEWLGDALLADDAISAYVAGIEDRELESLDVSVTVALVGYIGARTRLQVTTNQLLRELTDSRGSEA